MSDIVIRVESLSKQYRLGQISGTTLREDVQRWWARVRGQEDPTLKVTEANVRDRRRAEGKGGRAEGGKLKAEGGPAAAGCSGGCLSRGMRLRTGTATQSA